MMTFVYAAVDITHDGLLLLFVRSSYYEYKQKSTGSEVFFCAFLFIIEFPPLKRKKHGALKTSSNSSWNS